MLLWAKLVVISSIHNLRSVIPRQQKIHIIWLVCMFTWELSHQSSYNAVQVGCYKPQNNDDDDIKRFIPLDSSSLIVQYSSPAKQLHWHFSSGSHRNFPGCTYIGSTMTLAGYHFLIPVKHSRKWHIFNFLYNKNRCINTLCRALYF